LVAHRSIHKPSSSLGTRLAYVGISLRKGDAAKVIPCSIGQQATRCEQPPTNITSTLLLYIRGQRIHTQIVLAGSCSSFPDRVLDRLIVSFRDYE